MKITIDNKNWLTKVLVKEIRKVFKPRYNRKLTLSEIHEIAQSLTGFIEAYGRYQSGK